MCILFACTPNSEDKSARTFYRFDDHLETALALETLTVDSPPDLAVFPFADQASLGWSLHGENAKQTVEDGIWRIDASSNVYLQTNESLELRPDKAHAISITMRVSNADSVAFRWRIHGAPDFGDRGVLVINVPEQGAWNTYSIDPLSLPGWREAWWKIGDLRLELDAGTQLELDSFRIESKQRHFSENPVGTMFHSINYDLRPSLYAVAPSSVEFDIRPAAASRLSFGCGILNPNRPVTFKVSVTKAGQQFVLFEQTLESNARWRDFDIDMTAYAGETIRLAFHSTIQDGFNVGFWSSPLLYTETETTPNATQPLNVIVYLVDCLRADHLDCQGYHRVTAPFLTSMAANGTRFARCFTHETWTMPSVSSLFTGLPSSIHGVTMATGKVPETLVQLPEIFRAAGYTTLGLNENGGNGPPFSGLNRGFSSFVRPPLALKRANPDYTPEDVSDDMHRRAVAFLDRHKRRPFFLYYHTMELHAPYHVGEDYKFFGGETADLSPIDAYDCAIRRADDNLARLVRAVEDSGLADRTLIVLVADHGEAFGEHDNFYKHVGKPYNNQIHVPLVFYLPGTIPSGAVIDTNVQLTDLAPTLLELAGLSKAQHMRGQSLTPFLTEGMPPLPEDRTIFSFGRGTISVIQDDWKLMLDRRTGNALLFNIDSDYHETKDLARQEPAIAKALKQKWEQAHVRHQELAQILRSGETDTIAVDADREDALEALGYLE